MTAWPSLVERINSDLLTVRSSRIQLSFASDDTETARFSLFDRAGELATIEIPTALTEENAVEYCASAVQSFLVGEIITEPWPAWPSGGLLIADLNAAGRAIWRTEDDECIALIGDLRDRLSSKTR